MVSRKRILSQNIKRCCALLLSIFIIAGTVTVFAMPVSALSGNGTKSDPYVVTTFAELKDKINNNKAKASVYIKLGADIKYNTNNNTDYFVIDLNDSVELDLNGHILDVTSKTTNYALFELNHYAKLHVYDSKKNGGKIKWNQQIGDKSYASIFTVEGYNKECHLIIDSGTYEGRELVGSSTGDGCAVINGGTFITLHHTNVYLDSFHFRSDSKASLIINDGVFKFESPSGSPLCSYNAEGELIINGGEFISAADWAIINVNNTKNVKRIAINGGIFRNTNKDLTYGTGYGSGMIPLFDENGNTVINSAVIEYATPSRLATSLDRINGAFIRCDNGEPVYYDSKNPFNDVKAKKFEIYRPEIIEFSVDNVTYAAHGDNEVLKVVNDKIPLSYKCTELPSWLQSKGYYYVAAMHATQYPNLVYGKNKSSASDSLYTVKGKVYDVHATLYLYNKNDSRVTTVKSRTVTVKTPIPVIQNLRWEGTVAKWDAISFAERYRINLYVDGYWVSLNVPFGNATQYDFSKDMARYGTGKYRFDVAAEIADENGPVSEKSAEYKYISPSDIVTVNNVEIITVVKDFAPIIGQEFDEEIIAGGNVTVTGEPAYLVDYVFHWNKVGNDGSLTIMCNGDIVTEGRYVLTTQLRIDRNNIMNGKNGETHKLGKTVKLKVNGVTWNIIGETQYGADYSFVNVSSPQMSAVSAGVLDNAIPGDADCNKVVNADDAIYVLYSAMLPDIYPMSQRGDYNGDGKFDIEDAIYLLMHTMLPDLYPLSHLSV